MGRGCMFTCRKNPIIWPIHEAHVEQITGCDTCRDTCDYRFVIPTNPWCKDGYDIYIYVYLWCTMFTDADICFAMFVISNLQKMST